MPALLRNLLAFGRLLRRLGLDVHVGRMVDVTDALRHVDLARRDDVYFTCRALLVHRHEDLAIFDRAFAAFWQGTPVTPDEETLPGDGRESAPGATELALAPADAEAAESEDDAPAEQPAWSDADALATRDFAEFTPEELALARAALDRLAWQPGLRRTRRWRPGRGPRLDLRRALARSVRTGGDVVALPRRRRRERPRPLVLLCDVSGSMEAYSRLLLHFAHALTRRHRRVESFLFSTRLTRITRQLGSRRVDDAVAAASRTVPDWSGGTRIGASLVEFHRRWGRRVLTGGPVVLLISDGWDRGEPDVLRDAIARLQRSCHRLIWLNPLIGTQDYAPLTRGLQAALPHVDSFLPARTLRDFGDLAALLARGSRGVRGRRSSLRGAGSSDPADKPS